MEENKKTLNAFSLVGFILGLLSILLYWVLAITPILAIIFSLIGLIGTDKAKQKGKGLAIAGLILGILYTGLFGLNIYLKNNNYFQDNEVIDTYEEKSQNNFIGNWKHIEYEGNIKFETKYFIKDSTYTYECIIYINEAIDKWFRHSGTIQVLGDKALLTKTDYINMYNSPTDISKTNYEIEYRDGKLIGNYEYEKIN